ncbi:hypothetical protein LIER_08869 [Lithospermum erythrorhizon]|uniref:Uncharacterized protein n=1 Tax=Lithospermum erythrorhizon TaxID=34254 RepID=A0AAV3PIC3_LITER
MATIRSIIAGSSKFRIFPSPVSPLVKHAWCTSSGIRFLVEPFQDFIEILGQHVHGFSKILVAIFRVTSL